MANPEMKFRPEREVPQHTDEPLSRDRILNLSPQETVNYLGSLEETGDLESFLEDAAEDEALKAHLSYWEKWLEKDQQALLEKIIDRKKEIYPLKSESLPLELEKKFTEKQLEMIFSNVKAIQLTFGCSKGCAFCGFDAIKGVREHIPYSQLANMFQRYGKELSKGEPFLYWASEPSDYASKEGLEDRTYEDVHELAVQYAGYDPGVTSFNLTDKKWIDFMARKTSAYRTGRRLSVFGMKEEKLQALQHRVRESEEEIKFSGKKAQRVSLFGKEYKHVKGMGKTFEEEEDVEDVPKAGIACVDGVLLTPRGLFNLFVIPISREYPQGVIITPLEKISDDPVKSGDELREVMRRSVVEGEYSHAGAISKGEEFQRYFGRFPKKAKVSTAQQRYSVSVDKYGYVLECKLIESDGENLTTVEK